MIETLGLVVALLIGGVLGLLGGGGSILAMPAFVYLLGIETKAAIIGSLVVVGIASLVGGFSGLRRGEVDIRRGAMFIIGSIPGAFIGALAGRVLDETIQMILFALIMVAAAIAMLLRRQRLDADDRDAQSITVAPSLGRTAGAIGIGLMVGILTGVVGAGGGFLIVPALTLFLGVSIRRAMSTSLMIIALNSLAGLVGYLADAGTIASLSDIVVGRFSYPAYLALFTLLLAAGVMVADRARASIRTVTLQRMFAIFLLVLGTAVFAINIA